MSCYGSIQLCVFKFGRYSFISFVLHFVSSLCMSLFMYVVRSLCMSLFRVFIRSFVIPSGSSLFVYFGRYLFSCVSFLVLFIYVFS